MIEIYLAVLLFGLGTYFKNDVLNKTPQGTTAVNPNLNTSNNLNQAKLPIGTEQVSDAVTRLENKYGESLDKKCREIQPRDFSNLLDDKSKDLYKKRKLNERGQADADETDSGILKYEAKTLSKRLKYAMIKFL